MPTESKGPQDFSFAGLVKRFATLILPLVVGKVSAEQQVDSSLTSTPLATSPDSVAKAIGKKYTPLQVGAKTTPLQYFSEKPLEIGDVDINFVNPDGLTAAAYAVRDGNLEMLRSLIDQGADVNIETYRGSGTNLLMFALEKKASAEIIELLSSKVDDIDAVDSNRWTATMYAVRDKNLEALEILITAGANLDKRDSMSRNLLDFALVKKASAEIIELISSKIRDINAVDSNGWNAAMYAARDGNIEALRILIKNGVNPDEKNSAGQNLLMDAAEFNDDTKILEFLTEDHSFDVNAVDHDGWTEAFHAVRHGNLEILKWLKGHGAKLDAVNLGGQNLLMVAAEFSDDTKILDLLTENHSFDVDATDHDGWTAAVYAVRHGNLEMLKRLKEHGAKLDAESLHGRNLLMDAAEFNDDTKILEFLLNAGVFTNIDAVDSNGWTAAAYAVGHENLEALKILIKNGADKNHKTSDHHVNFLMRAAETSFVNTDAMLTYLIKDLEIELEEKDFLGGTALLYAVIGNNEKSLRFLNSQGADIKCRDYYARGLIEIDRESNEQRLKDVLIELGAAEEIKYHEFDESLAHNAIAEGLDAVKSLVEKDRVFLTGSAPTSERHTLLIMATHANKTDIVEYLASQKDLDINAQDPFGQTAFFFAAREHNSEIMKILRDHGADMGIKTDQGLNSLTIAEHLHDLSSEKELLKLNFNTSARDNYGLNAAMTAIIDSDIDGLKLILEQTPSLVNESTDNKRFVARVGKVDRAATYESHSNTTPLMLSVIFSTSEITELLLQKGAELNDVNDENYTAAMLAAKHGRLDNLKSLITHKADIAIKNSDGKTALDIAKENESFTKEDIESVQKLAAPSYQKQNLRGTSQRTEADSTNSSKDESNLKPLTFLAVTGAAAIAAAALSSEKTKPSKVHTV